MRRLFPCLAAVVLLALLAAARSQAQPGVLNLDHPAIAYGGAPRTDAVAQLNERLQKGTSQLVREERAGYLRSLLALLHVPVESQIVVYSKTSLQSPLISPSNPRAIYFNDNVAVGWMRGGIIEIAAHDPVHGAAFYVLPQVQMAQPLPVRAPACLGCHYSAAAGGVPGLLVRSIPTAADGTTLQWLGNFTTDHRSPLDERWGGWFVTGSHGAMRHLGNLTIADRRAQELPAWKAERTLKTLEGRFDTGDYLSPHSDIVALLVFDHQARLANLLTRVGWEARIATHDGREPGADITVREGVRELVDYMLFVGEAPIDGIRGTSGFAERFSAAGPRDSKGRSLRDLDLGRRLMRFPCSYMIYSAAFDGLPAAARELVYRRMKDILSGTQAGAAYAHLSRADREAILEILRDTKKDLPAWF
jgi:hypothetical protein